MLTARVKIFAPVASFRYPFFLVGNQPTYIMPPPSTIYGHVASALGTDPGPFRFAYHCTFASKTRDLEHQHIISRSAPEKLNRQESARLRVWRDSQLLAVGGSIQPTFREFLFNVELTLYLDPPSLGSAFRSPVFPVVLGRSEDLASIQTVDELELPEADGAFFECTLLPFSWRAHTALGSTLLMSRFIGPPPERDVSFAQYIALRPGETIYGGSADLSPNDHRRLLRDGTRERWFVDTSTAMRLGVHRGVVFHSFTD